MIFDHVFNEVVFDILIFLIFISMFWPFDVLIFDVPTPSPPFDVITLVKSYIDYMRKMMAMATFTTIGASLCDQNGVESS